MGSVQEPLAGCAPQVPVVHAVHFLALLGITLGLPQVGRQSWSVGLGLSGLWLQVDGGPPALEGATTRRISVERSET